MVCVTGTVVDGHAYATQAIERGAVALLVEREVARPDHVPAVRVPSARKALPLVADRFFDHPSGELDVVGITGTDGKTTIANLAASIGRVAGWNPGVVGTLGIRHAACDEGTPNTTPGPDRFQSSLRDMVDGGAGAVMVEVSSHALDMSRTDGTEFRVVVLSNLTRDHLDWHGTLDAYRQAKARLFRRDEWRLDPEADTGRASLAVLPGDDPAGRWMGEQSDLGRVWYGFDDEADWRITDPVLEATESRARLVGPVEAFDIRVPLPGRFNLRNAAAAAIACRFLGASVEEVRTGLWEVARIPGRMEAVDHGQPFAVLVDFAHTPDALETVLQAAREFTEGRLLCVIGAGGDRDRGKRPEMARVATTLADRVYLTSDNPRHEDPEQILDDMERGVTPDGSWRRVSDRAAAIVAAIEEAVSSDTVIVAGKGHETHQQIGSERIPFDDRMVSATALKGRGYDPAGGGRDT
jgi:UDP-N-acetylmuramoyl-L-alanyl-D-glutamate--2,6-diaminopimelate ligase